MAQEPVNNPEQRRVTAMFDYWLKDRCLIYSKDKYRIHDRPEMKFSKTLQFLIAQQFYSGNLVAFSIPLCMNYLIFSRISIPFCPTKTITITNLKKKVYNLTHISRPTSMHVPQTARQIAVRS
jgi:hypothetical protein